MSRGVKLVSLIIVGLVAAALLVCGGFLLGANPQVRGALAPVLPDSVVGGDFALQGEVLQKLESHFYKPFDPADLKEGAINGMVAGLEDEYTVYWNPEEYAFYAERISGEYSGVGMTVQMKDNLVTVVNTLDGSPAEAAGILAGDIVVAVDGVSAEGQDLDQVVSKIRGVEGTVVTVAMYRPPVSATTTTTVAAGGSGPQEEEKATVMPTADLSKLPPGGKTQEYDLTRRTLEIPVTKTEILDVDGEKVAFITFATFTIDSGVKLQNAVEQAIERDGATSIILDLRGNVGGIFDEALTVAGIFLPKGEVIVSQEGQHVERQVYYSKGDVHTDVPLIVLVDEYSASASEIVAGALQDHERATLVGETTFSKGLVQSILSLSNGGALKVTTAIYLTPNGRDINETGIIPDVVAPDDPATEVDETLQRGKELIAAGLTP